MTKPLQYADIDWNESGVPVSRRFADVYFSPEGGLDEARYVFLQGNHLEQRLSTRRNFTIGETGFGSGLNFLALWQLWQRVAPTNARLCFFSAEKYPLRPEDMARVHGLFPELAPFAQELRDALPLPVPGYHRITLAGGRIQLTLMYGEALHMLQQQDCKADAWFLDGFAPRLNPAIWGVEVAQELWRLSASGATFATFSTSVTTKDSLSQAGFDLHKRAGFGSKKYMLMGALAGDNTDRAMPTAVTVVGAGLAGAAVAHALALRGCAVTVQEQAQAVATGASGNPSAIFYPGVTVGWQPLSQLYFMGFSHTLGLLRRLAVSHTIDHDLCGMLLFPKPNEDPVRQTKVLATMQPDASVFREVDAAAASTIAGIPLPQGGLYFPASGWVHVGQLTQALLAHPNIHIQTTTAVAALPQMPVVLCTGWQGQALHPALQNAMHPVGGQVSCVQGAAALQGLRCVLSYGGYATPAIDGAHYLGATYDKQLAKSNNVAVAHAQNIRKLADFMGEPLVDAVATHSWAAIRSVSKNRLPLVGKLGEGVYASIAHASRGLLSCALSGEYVASQLCGDPLPLPRDIAHLLRPDRFS